jgi:hypothetical protein
LLSLKRHVTTSFFMTILFLHVLQVDSYSEYTLN